MADFLEFYALPTALIVVYVVAVLVPLLLAVAYMTYAERTVIAAVNLRRGPTVVGPFGLLQPFADALKLLFKEPQKSGRSHIPTSHSRITKPTAMVSR